MKLKFLVVAIVCLLGSVVAKAHDYHASITDIQFNPRTQSLQVAVKVFTDDLENALTKRSKSKVTYDAASESVKQHVANYMAATLKFETTQGKPLKQHFVGSEPDADVVWIYLEVPVQQTALAELTVGHSVLTELFDDQMNIVNLNYKGKTHSTLFNKEERTKKFTFTASAQQ